MNTKNKNNKPLYDQLLRVPSGKLKWIDVILSWVLNNVILSSLPIVIGFVLSYTVPSWKQPANEVVLSLCVTAISVAAINSNFPDEIRDTKRMVQRWLSILTYLLTIIFTILIIVFNLRNQVTGVNTNTIFSISIICTIAGIAIGFASYLIQLFAIDEKLMLAKGELLEDFRKRLEQESNVNAAAAQSNNRVNGVKI
ncbi:hypothetical protein H6F87_13230 [Cyanobacteria bacterium FACHB-502]|nr:hypothetical protein [Cyanobacteria bacterium FACHB-502]